jgi:hypothetical protein
MIITLCGSKRFEPWFHAWNEALTLSGHLVFAPASHPSQGMDYTEEEERVLDSVHKAKIDASEAILVFNVFAYMADGALAKVLHAREKGKEVYFLESWGMGLGIDTSHGKATRDAALRYGVPAMFGSPIPTCDFPDPWRLLPPVSPRRTRIVNLLEKRLKPLGRGP